MSTEPRRSRRPRSQSPEEQPRRVRRRRHARSHDDEPSRRSRRLRGQIPEETLLQQVCFICQRDIHIDSLAMCQRTPCCGVFTHRRCYQEMERRVLTCGNCRRVIDDIQPEVVLETDEEMGEDDDDAATFVLPSGSNRAFVRFERELERYRSESRPNHCHHEGSYLWYELPYDLDPDIWRLYYVRLRNFVILFPDRDLYIHGIVQLPVEPTREVRAILYRLFIYNTPFALYDLIRIQRFRLFFRRVEGLRSIVIQFVHLLPYPGGPSTYPEDGLWT